MRARWFQNPVIKIVLVRGGQITLVVLLAEWIFRIALTSHLSHLIGAITTLGLIAYFSFVFIAPWTWGLPIVTQMRTTSQVIALTFDDGPSPETTPKILDVLAQYKTHATFFMLGELVMRYPELVRRIVEEGHSIGIHSFSHRELVLASAQTIRQQVAETKQALTEAGGGVKDMRWFRPPYGFKTWQLFAITRQEKCRMVTWSVDSRDYRLQNAEKIAAYAVQAIRPGAIVLLHDGPNNKTTALALPLILNKLMTLGYESKTLDELAGIL